MPLQRSINTAAEVNSELSPATEDGWLYRSDVALADSTGAFTLWLAQHAADAAIVRPDRFVFGLYTAAEVPAALSLLAVSGILQPLGSSSSLPPPPALDRQEVASLTTTHTIKPRRRFIFPCATAFRSKLAAGATGGPAAVVGTEAAPPPPPRVPAISVRISAWLLALWRLAAALQFIDASTARAALLATAAVLYACLRMSIR
jgi:hypothetical protein